jgi:hypothetical protein
MGAAIIAGVDAAPVPESAEHVLDLAPAAVVQHGVVRDWCLPVSLGRDAGGDPSVGQAGTKPVCVIDAYNFARRLMTLRDLTPYQAICKVWADEPDRFRINPLHLTSGLNT